MTNSIDEQVPNNIKEGMYVEINPQSDHTRKEIISGIVSKVLTKSTTHPHGILVLLESGKKGRVKKITQNKPASNLATDDGTEGQMHTTVSLTELILQGENHNVEFKSGVLWSSNFTNEDIKNYRPQSKDLHLYGQITSKVIISKTIAGFLNSDGGVLIIGVKENKDTTEDEVIGIEPELKYLKDSCQDGYRRMIIDLIKDYFSTSIFNHLNQYLHIRFEKINNDLVCGIFASKSDQRVFIKVKDKDYFYIRTDASTRELTGEALLSYCDKRF